jgi:orotate phosphoribosyltransferase
MTDPQLAAALRSAAYLEGDFVLRSGKRSKYYLDKYLFETQPSLLRELARRFATHIDSDIQRIAGPELGGVALAAAAALESDRPFVIVRNSKKSDYGTGKLIEGLLNPGDRVVMVEDIATSGGQAIEACRVLVEAGAVVAKVVVVIDREEGGVQRISAAGYPCVALFTSTQLGIAING